MSREEILAAYTELEPEDIEQALPYAAEAVGATEHLTVALERSEQRRSFAKEDSDLDSIRDEPAFKPWSAPEAEGQTRRGFERLRASAARPARGSPGQRSAPPAPDCADSESGKSR
jgi:hypothetical protein